MEFKGKTCVVTGAAGGIGYAVCEAYASNGANVAMIDINQEALDAKAAKLKEDYGTETLTLVVDLASVAEIREAAAKIEEKFGAIQALANCAGVSIYGDPLTYTEEDWDKSLDTNLKGTFFLTQAVANNMVKNKVKGKIVSIASQAGVIGEPNGHAYGASKAGVCMITQTLAIDLAQYGICVSAIAPGITKTGMIEKYLEEEAPRQGMTKEEFEAFRCAEIPLKRFAEPREVADLIYFLSSEKASYLTGSTYNITGGNVNV
ncbi:SDR family NAD(P)-dependent oxidoreductase [Zhenpiania hominis]|uniref:SDR family NAD(P)-dependent oxidoreductase n=1 Tax=Zhenpiania hominis TaxID=2763644 RepID=UPI0039F5FC96